MLSRFLCSLTPRFFFLFRCATCTRLQLDIEKRHTFAQPTLSGRERMKRLRRNLIRSRRHKQSLATADPFGAAAADGQGPEDEGVSEHATVYDVYGTNLLDHADRSDDEDAGDYNTQ